MTKTLQSTFAIALGIAVLAQLAKPVQAQQYVVPEDYDVVWTLDPRDHTALFTTTSFGARSTFTGMDFDGDGNKEFLFTTDESIANPPIDPGILQLFLYENTGDNEYEYVWHYTNDRMTNSFPPVAWGDVDDDGLWEIYLGIPASPNAPEPPPLLFIFEQDDEGVFPNEPTAVYDYGKQAADDFRPSSLQIVDVDQDGQLEIITGSRTVGARELVVMTANDIGEFTTFNHEYTAGEVELGGGSIYDIMVVDFDDDGLNEIWVNTWNEGSMAIFESTAADTYELQVDINEFDTTMTDAGSHNAHDMLFADLDEDGALEGFFPMTNGRFYYVEDTDDVSTLTGESFLTLGQFGEIARGADMGDLDGDGNVDFIVSTHTDETFERIEFMGGDPADSTSYEWTTLLDSSTDATGVEGYYPSKIADDLDGDGMNELVIANLDAPNAGMHTIIILEFNGMIVGVDEPTVLEGFTLHQNYPNPFSGETRVRVELDRPSDIALEVFDVTGRRVRVLESGFMSEGSHEVTFSADDLPSGVYLIRLDTPSGSLTRTATIVR